jgi:glycosyltransferase involved in cell wall biosynthesis
MNSTVSVIIPCYNSSDTIKRAINSVIAQSYSCAELILVDDASNDSDALIKIVDSYKVEWIKYIRHEVNKNGSSARNTGIRLATGEYMFFLDADDEWEADHIKNSLVYLKENSNSIIYSKCRVITAGNKRMIMPLNSIQKKQTVAEYLFCTGGYIATPSISANSTVFKNNLFDESLSRHQDYELLLRLYSLGINFICTEKIDVIVHWEYNDVEKKGGTINYSLEFAKRYIHYFNKKSYTYFMLKNVVFLLFQKKQKLKGLRIFFKECSLLRIGFREWFFFFEYLFFSELFFVNLYVKLFK